MADPKHDDGARLDLGDEEQWVLHAALLQYLDRRAEEAATSTGTDIESVSASEEDGTDEATENAIDLLESLESGEALHLERESLLLVRELLSEYLAGAPLRDRATCRSVLAEVRDEL
jgi:acyl-CoA thioesterase FadM